MPTSASGTRARLGALVVISLTASSLWSAPVMAADPGTIKGPDGRSVRSASPTVHSRGRVVLEDAATASQPRDGDASTRYPTGPYGRIETTLAPPTTFSTANSTIPPSRRHIGGAQTVVFDIPEATVAAGPDHVAHTYDRSLQITDRNGGNALTVPFQDFFLVPDDLVVDDFRIYYDAAHARWVAVEVSFNCEVDNYVDFAISDSANPRGGWSVYYINFPNARPSLPSFGNSADKFGIAFHLEYAEPLCHATSDDELDLYVFDWADVLSGGPFDADAWALSPGVAFDTEAYVPYSIAPALQQPATSNVLHVGAILHNQVMDADNFWHLSVSGSVPGATLHVEDLSRDDVVRPFAGFIDSEQGGGKQALQPSLRPTAIWHDGRLVLAMTERCMPPADVERNCVRIVDLNVPSGGATTLRQDAYIGQAGRSFFSPGAAFAEDGNLFVTFSRSSQIDVPSVFVVRQAPTDPINTFSARQLLFAADDFQNGFYGPQITGPAADPLVPDAVWATGIAASSGTWKSFVAQLTTATGDTFVALEPLRVLDTRDGTGLSGPFLNNIPRTLGVAGEGTIPVDAVAITGNLTVAGQTSGGYVSAGPTITANPTSSTINFPLGDNRANNLTLPLNADGDLMAVFKGAPTKSTHLILDVTGYFLADDSGSTYKPLTAARVLDTRVGTGLSGKFLANNPRSFQVTGIGGVGGIPAGATAVTGNLTVVGQTRTGYVTLAPEPDPTPETSTINFPLGDTRANGVTVPLSETGSLSAVFKASGGSTDLIFDVTGYYLDDLTGLRFYPLNPGRIMDTRFSTLTQLFGPFSNSVPRTLVTGGHFGVPGSALAVTGNLTVVGQTKAGYVSITKNPVASPPVSTINFPFGDIRANGVTVPLNAANDMALVYKGSSGAATHLILDLTGYFR